jgi:hypothetical protein
MRSLLLLGLEPLAKLVLLDLVTNQILAQTGVEGTGQVGTVSIYAAANTGVTGVSGTSTLGDVSLVTNNIIAETGVAGTTALGTVSVVAEANVAVTGESASAVLGNISLVTNNIISVTGLLVPPLLEMRRLPALVYNSNGACRYNCSWYSFSVWYS